MLDNGDQNVILAAVGTLLTALLSFLGWHGRVQAGHVTDLRDRTARLEATNVNIEDFRKVLREEIGIHLSSIDRRLDKQEKDHADLRKTVTQLQIAMPKRAGDKPMSR